MARPLRRRGCGTLASMSTSAAPLRRDALQAARETTAVFPRVRWMGSKYRLLPHLAQTFAHVGGTTALDAFSGSGVVSYLLKKQGFQVHSNDYLGFPATIATATVVNQATRLTREDVGRVLGPPGDERSFIRDTFAGVFYNDDDLRFLDSAWSHIDRMSGHKRAVTISALCLAAARKQPRGVFTISGDLSHYDDGRRDLRIPLRQHFAERVAEYNASIFSGPRCKVTAHEVSELEHRRYDVVYLDPPYAPPRDDNDYTKRFHFLEGLSRYWVGDTIMEQTKTKKLPKRITKFSTKRTIEEGFRDLFKRFHDSTIVLSYSSNAYPDLDALTGLLGEFKDDVQVRSIEHTYHYGTHSAATRRAVDEYIFVAR